MKHEELVRKLDCYVDGDLSDPAKREVEDHLADCASCREELKRIGRLLDHAMVLRERPIVPARDLWPELTERLAPADDGPSQCVTQHSRGFPASQKRKHELFGLRPPVWKLRSAWSPAAGLAAALVLIAAVWSVVSRIQEGGPTRDVAWHEPAEQQTIGHLGGTAASRDESGTRPRDGTCLSAELAALDAEYEASLSQVVHAAEAAGEGSRDSGWSVFERNLSVLDEAIRESRQALEHDPGNPFLQRVLLHAYQRQLDLLRWAHRVIGHT